MKEYRFHVWILANNIDQANDALGELPGILDWAYEGEDE